jgi:hypothetical protein
MTPVVLCYQAWSYWVFRKRIGRSDIPGPTDPAARDRTDPAARDRTNPAISSSS